MRRLALLACVALSLSATAALFATAARAQEASPPADPPLPPATTDEVPPPPRDEVPPPPSDEVPPPPSDEVPPPPSDAVPPPREEAPSDEVPPPPTSARPRAVQQATDDERVPVARPVDVRRGRRVAERPRVVTPAEALGSPIPPPPDPYAGRRYAVRPAQRTLTLAEGVWRVDQAIDWNLVFGLEAPNQISAGLSNDVEVGVAWPWTRDPTFFGTVRLHGEDLIDVGVRASVTVPAITTGTTVVRAGIPIVIRPTSFLRIQTGLDIDLLLTPQISPWAVVPLQVLANVTRRFFLGAQGAAGWVDGRAWTGQVGVFLGHTVSATEGHPIFEVRLVTTYVIDLQDFHITAALSFFPRFW